MKNPTLSLLLALLTVFLFLNILYSQNIASFYFGLVNEDQQAAIEFLKKIKKLPDFDAQFHEYKQTFGSVIEEEVFAQERNRRKMIRELQALLDKNPQSRDVLYALYLLEKEEGDVKLAEGYLKRAKDVDPTIEEND